MISKNFIKSSFVYSIVGSLPLVSGIILIPSFTKLLTPEQFGINAILLTILYFVQILSNFSLDTLIGIHYYDHKDDERSLQKFIGSVITMLLVFGGIVAIISLLSGKFIFSFIFPLEEISFYPFGIITVFTAIFNGFLKTYSSLLINQQKPIRFFWLNTLNFSLTIVISLCFIYSKPFSLIGPLLGRLLPAIISFLTILFFILKENKLSYSPELIKAIRSFCPPLLLYSIFIWIITYIDRFIIKSFLIDATFVGIFDFTIKCSMLIEIIQLGIINSIHPRVYNIWKDQGLRESTPEVNKYYHSFTALSLLIIPIFILIIPILVPLFIKKQIYYESFNFLPIICLGFASRGLFNLFLAPIFYFKKTSVLPKIYIFIACIQIVMTYLLVKYFGLLGAAWSSFLVKIVQVVFLYFESKKIFIFKFNVLKLVYLPIFYVLFVIGTNILFKNYMPIFVEGLQCLVSYALVYFVYRRELSKFWHQLNIKRIFLR